MEERRNVSGTVKIHRMDLSDGGVCKAYVSVIVADMFIIRNIKIIEGSQGVFVEMPKERYTNRKGEEKTVERVFPASLEIRERINEMILGEYKKRAGQ